MNKRSSLFEVYPNNSLATNLSIAGGGLKIISILLLIAAIPATLAVILASVRLISASGVVTALIFMLDEFDEMLFIVFLLWSAFIIFRYISYILHAKAALINSKTNITENINE